MDRKFENGKLTPELQALQTRVVSAGLGRNADGWGATEMNDNKLGLVKFTRDGGAVVFPANYQVGIPPRNRSRKLRGTS